MNVKYKSIFVPEDLHKRIKLQAIKKSMTMIEYVNYLWQMDVKKTKNGTA